MRYTEFNCTDVATINGTAQWKEADGIVKKFFDSSQTNEIVATCAFYETHWYECYGVADCSKGDQGILSCAGSAPWRGFYDASPLERSGWTGNVTEEAKNGGGGFPSKKGDISGIDFDSSNNTKDFAFNAFIDDDKLWPNAIIPYTINEEEFSLENLFKKYSGRTFDLPYDYSSIMHYAHNEFSKQPEVLPTILPKSAAAIGNRYELSETDIKRINALYQCNSGRTGNPKHVPVESSTQVNKKTTATEAVFPEYFAVEDGRPTLGISKHQSGAATVEPFLRNLTECPAHLNGMALSQCVTDSQCIAEGLGRSCCQRCAKNVCNTYCTDQQAGPTTGEVATTMIVDENPARTPPSGPIIDDYKPHTSTLHGHGPSTENNTATIGNVTFYPVFVAPSVANYFCYFYTNQTYTCKTSCDASGGELKLANFTSGSKKKYYDMDCAAEVPLSPEKRWEIGPNSLVPKIFNTGVGDEILATCAFYHSRDFDCNGVTDCMEAKNENRCGSAAPWRRFSGSPEEGLKLNGTIIKTGSDAG
ncbi:hypothetical protein BV898_17870 [Hypsibius exemplaris]|uniref:Metalloendopeptidase n=1 Tax=Hypsibius exemplaris TaxID=2072580 RepID=A0A9X6NG43_HYPEX|nr:hypothetical protein BV898_17870 [Hypsibius exemplaris]